MCRLCFQYVGLASGEKNDPHFRHRSREADKTCPERTQSFASLRYDASLPNIPIRLRISEDGAFTFEMGLLWVPPELMQKAEFGSVTIYGYDRSGQLCQKLHFNLGERLNHDGVTWLSIGDSLLFRYRILLPAELSSLRKYWPEDVKGIDYGCLFDCVSKKKLPFAADVQVGKEYYLLTYEIICPAEETLHVTFISAYQSLNLYVICATENTTAAAEFFLQFRCRLTDIPISVTPLWPLSVKKPYVLLHCASQMWFHIQGKNVITNSFPSTQRECFPCNNGTVDVIRCTEWQQLFSAGRDNAMLRFTYLWRDGLEKTEPLPAPAVTDMQGNLILPGENAKLPPSQTLLICTPFDGYLNLIRNGLIVEKREIVSGKSLYVDHLTYGMEVCIYQGLDCVWRVLFQRAKEAELSDDAALVQKLSNGHGLPCAVPNWGSVLLSLKGYPKVKRWFLQKRAMGSLPEDSCRLLRRFLLNQKCALREK